MSILYSIRNDNTFNVLQYNIQIQSKKVILCQVPISILLSIKFDPTYITTPFAM